MFARWGGDCSSPLMTPFRFDCGVAMPTFSARHVHATLMPEVNVEWQMLARLPVRPHPPCAMYTDQKRALLINVSCTASGRRPFAERYRLTASMTDFSVLDGAGACHDESATLLRTAAQPVVPRASVIAM